MSTETIEETGGRHLTLADLDEYVASQHVGRVIVVNVEEWERLRLYIEEKQVVAATEDRPAFFWFKDHRVVTLAYMDWRDTERLKLAEQEAPRARGAHR